MKRATCAGVLLLLFASLQVRAGLHGATFIFKSVDGDVALLHPVIAPEITVQLEKGPHEITRGEVLVCKSGIESHKVMDGGQEAVVSELILTCDSRIFHVKGIRFAED